MAIGRSLQQALKIDVNFVVLAELCDLVIQGHYDPNGDTPDGYHIAIGLASRQHQLERKITTQNCISHSQSVVTVYVRPQATFAV
jgi:hypothetical protein